MKVDYRRQAILQRYVEEHCSGSVQFALRARTLCSCAPIIDSTNKKVLPESTARVDVMVTKHGDGRRTGWFRGLKTCKNRWSCPVCTPVRLQHDRIKLKMIIERQMSLGRVAIMTTLTIPHYIDETAGQVLFHLRRCKEKYDDYIWQRLKKSGILTYGTITSTECKYNSWNGFHFHIHLLTFVDAAAEAKYRKCETVMKEHWAQLIKPLRRHGESDTAGLVMSKHRITNADYIAKEMAKTSGGNKSYKTYSMFELLDYPELRGKFIEFALAVKGYARIFCSSGLCRGIDEEEVKKKLRENADVSSAAVVGSYTYDAWYEICQREIDDGINYRYWLIFNAELDGVDGVFNYSLRRGLPLPRYLPEAEEVQGSSAIADDDIS